MGHANGVITAPVNTDDVVAATTYNNHDLGHFCSASNPHIQKWSMWKPYRCSGNASPTNLQVAQMHFGINVSAARHVGLENAIRDVDASQPAPSSLVAPSGAYAYIRPTGGASSPYRITDFADFRDDTAPSELKFDRQYDHKACAPDEWHDWEMSESLLTSLASKTVSSIPGGTDWTLSSNNTGISYSACSLKYGKSTQDVIGYRPSNAMPLTFLFGNDTIANEKWRLGLAVYLPYGLSSVSTSARWMVFAGRKPLASSNGGDALPNTASNIELCQALYYNFKTKGVKSFTFVPCILLNSTLDGTGVYPNVYTTRVALLASFNAQLLIPPTFTKCTLTINPNPIPGEVVDYYDETYRGRYATNLVAGTYKVHVGGVDSTSSGTTRADYYYRVTIPSGTSITITHKTSGYESTGNLQISASGSNVTYYEYANVSDWNGNKNAGAVKSTTPSSAGLKFFTSYVGVSVPSSVTPLLYVTKV